MTVKNIKFMIFVALTGGTVTDMGKFSYLVSAKESGLNAYVLTNTPDVDARGAIVKAYLAGEDNENAQYILLRFTMYL